MSKNINSSNLISALKQIIEKYPDCIKKYLLSRKFNGISTPEVKTMFFSNIFSPQKYMNIIDSINDIVTHSLRKAKSNPNIPQITTSDTLFFGDIHSQLDLFVQNLFISGLIDNNGNITNPKTAPYTVIQLGDIIDTGKYTLETVLFMSAFQLEAKKNNINVIRLAGNHEFHLINSLPSSEKMMTVKDILLCEICNDQIRLAHSNKDHNYYALHGGMQKTTLIKILVNMANDPNYSKFFEPKLEQLRELYINNKYKRLIDKTKEAPIYEYFKNQTSTTKIYTDFIDALGLSITDITDFVNSEFKKAAKEILETGKPLCYNHPSKFITVSEGSIIYARKKALTNHNTNRGKNGYNDFIIKPDMKKYNIKPAQFVGHNCTNNGILDFYGKKGGIMQNRANIFCDAGLTSLHGGSQAFVCANFDTKNVYAVEICENGKMKRGLNEKSLPIKIEKKINNIVIRRLEGIDMCLKKNVKETEDHKLAKYTTFQAPLSLALFEV